MAVLASATASGCLFYQGQPSFMIAALPAPDVGVTSNGSLSPGYYYVAYTFADADGNETNASPYQTVNVGSGNVQSLIVVPEQTQNILITIPTFPLGVAKAMIYIGTSSSSMRRSTSVTSAGTYTISTVPVSGPLAPTSSSGLNGLLYTAPSSSANVTSPSATAYVKEIVLTNTTSAAATVSLYSIASGASTYDPSFLTNYTIAAYDTKIFTGLNLMLMPGSSLVASQGTAGAITVTISGVEVQ
ncbi:hypothetical protein [Tumebacillus flagellatus]|uniref:hypothetical protein n=1 Tax=Tumebacillus flagellatus TaxID=1157490 RepID=UPI0012696383|nr:hypothetical protein [Tumebacillus flagellatus]